MTSASWQFFASAPSAGFICRVHSMAWCGRNRATRPSAVSTAFVRSGGAVIIMGGRQTVAAHRPSARNALLPLLETSTGLGADGADAKMTTMRGGCHGR
jgi:hypothetical protein